MVPVVITITSLTLVLWVVALESESLTTPGPLHPSHAAIAELAGGNGCATCHGAGAQSMAEACGLCHVEVSRQIDDARSLHGQLGANSIDDCQRCHREHNAGAVALVSTISFSGAGIDDPDVYDHRHIADFILGDRHDELNCVTCHSNADAPSLRSGERRFMGLQQDCVSCHADPHVPTQGLDCASCHGQEHPFDQVAMFEHMDEFPLVGSHDEVACKKCHETDSVHAIGALRETPQEMRSCDECHVSPHSSDFLATVLGTPHGDGQESCLQCHDPIHDTFFSPPARMTPQQHARLGFPLDPPHDEPDCAACHTAPMQVVSVETSVLPHAFDQRFPGRQPDDCVSCHADPHLPTFGTDCVACHGKTQSFSLVAAFSHDASLELTGAHGNRQCTVCHDAQGAHSVVTLRAGPHPDRECVDCHSSTHRSAFLNEVSSLMAVKKTESCVQCHDAVPDGFSLSKATMTPQWHETTGFPLQKPHDQAECEACHTDFLSSEHAALGIARVPREPARKPDACRACHVDPHAGQFDLGGVERSCLDCHSAEHFEPSAFDVAAHEGGHFPLTVAHRGVACRSCHTMEEGVRRFVPLPTDCADCHTDVHEGLFASGDITFLKNGKTDCGRCHTATSFTEVTTSAELHLLWSDFPLRGAHATASCNECHSSRGEPNKFGLRLEPAPTDCVSCHEDPHVGQFVMERINDCSRCHEETKKFSQLVFDHQRDSKFKLDEFHRTLDCGVCHKAFQVESGSTVVHYRPMGTECADCHGER